MTHGLYGVFVGGAVLSAAAFLLSWLIREVPLRGSEEPLVEV